MTQTGFSFVARLLIILIFSSFNSFARADTFGSGGNSFDIEFVPIGDPGNIADTTGFPNPAGRVDYRYRMGKYEISEQMIEKANVAGGLGITKDTRGPDKPATNITWFEAARFVNWLNEDAGFSPAYKFVEIPPGPRGGPSTIELALWQPSDPGYDPDNLFRNSLARYVLPSADEWYKAAYYDPVGDVWNNYPTGIDPPTAVASGTASSTAVFRQDQFSGPADIMNSGGLSPFGTMAQGGNVLEWQETEIDRTNDFVGGRRFRRGGSWDASDFSLSVSAWGDSTPDITHFSLGFRVASIPEPTGFILIVFSLGGLFFRSAR